MKIRQFPAEQRTAPDVQPPSTELYSGRVSGTKVSTLGRSGASSGEDNMGELGKLLIMFGAMLLALGLLLVGLGQTNLPLGHLPGDIHYRGKNTTFYFPVMTCLLLSVVLSAVLYLVNHLRH
jgi:hypothetical protein